MLRLLAFAIVVTLVACPPAQAQARIDVWTLADDAAALSAEGRLREAIALLEEAVRAVPQNGALRLRLAELYLRADDRAAATPHLDAAIRDVTAYLATNPRSPEGSRNTLARAHALRGDAAQAEPLFRQNVAALEAEAQKQGTALTRDAKRTLAGTHTMLADAYAGLGDAAKARALRLDAVRLLEEAAAADPAAPYVHAQLAEVHEALGDAARARASQLAAIEAYKRVIDGPIAQSEREFQYIMLGRAYATMGDFTRARESYQTAGQRRPDGTPSAREAHARDVIVELEQRIARRQASSATPAEEHFRQAFDLLQAGKVDDATVEFQTGLRKKPGEPRAHFYVAEAYRRRGDVRPAIEHYRAALAGGVPDPLAAQARTEVASLYVEQVVQATRQRTGSFGALDRARTLARAALFHARIGAPARAQALFADALRTAEIDSESN
ncbi:MAG: tetratricopeptide repeat protein, partial [Candidatus Rokubacteria bacterium]|nr:tetratricopeptide repeat protein [Candidatus Rokubacteria bacterium]